MTTPQEKNYNYMPLNNVIGECQTLDLSGSIFSKGKGGPSRKGQKATDSLCEARKQIIPDSVKLR